MKFKQLFHGLGLPGVRLILWLVAIASVASSAIMVCPRYVGFFIGGILLVEVFWPSRGSK